MRIAERILRRDVAGLTATSLLFKQPVVIAGNDQLLCITSRMQHQFLRMFAHGAIHGVGVDNRAAMHCQYTPIYASSTVTLL